MAMGAITPARMMRLERRVAVWLGSCGSRGFDWSRLAFEVLALGLVMRRRCREDGAVAVAGALCSGGGSSKVSDVKGTAPRLRVGTGFRHGAELGLGMLSGVAAGRGWEGLAPAGVPRAHRLIRAEPGLRLCFGHSTYKRLVLFTKPGFTGKVVIFRCYSWLKVFCQIFGLNAK